MTSRLLCVRKVYQMTVVSIILVALTTLVIVLAIVLPTEAAPIVCQEIQVTMDVQENVIALEWNYNSCAVAHNITHIVNGVASNSLVIPDPIRSTEIPRVTCSENLLLVTLITFPNAGDFEAVSYAFRIGYTGNTEIESVIFNEANSRFEWDALDVPEACQLAYEVNFNNQVIDVVMNTTDPFYEIELHPCADNEIAVTSLIGFEDRRGESTTSGSYRGPTTREPAVHISTDPHQDRAYVTWHVQLEEFNFCEVEELRYELSGEDAPDLTLPRAFEEGIDFLYTLIPLHPLVRYQYRICYIFSEYDVNICSGTVEFISDPLSHPTLALTTDVEDGFYISWEQEYHIDFVTGHTLRIEPMGPEHFLPQACMEDLDMGAIVTFFPRGVNYFDFEDALHNSKYAVKVTTLFESLGMTTSSDQHIILTKEAKPGPLNVSRTYDYVPASPYDVSLKIAWDIPCDVNGRLQKFTYLLIGRLPADSSISCDDLVLASDVIDISGDLETQETHSISVEAIVPFFRYEFTVTTSLAEHENTVTMELDDVPPAFTPPY